jgi:hypothetical protein
LGRRPFHLGRRLVWLLALTTLLGTLAFERPKFAVAHSRLADGPWSFRDRPRINQTRVNGLDVGLGPGRFAVIAWSSTPIGIELDSGRSGRGGRVKVATRNARASRFRSPRVISARRAKAPVVATSDTGEAIVAWSNRRDRIQASIKRNGAGFKSPVTLSPPGRGTPFLSVGPDGTAVVAWAAGRGANRRIEASVRPPGARFEPAVTIANDDVGLYMSVSAGTAGLTTVAWSGPCPPGSPGAREPARASVVTASGVEPALVIPNSECPNAGLDIGMDEAGNVTALINGFLDRGVIKASSKLAGEAFTDATRISREGTAAYFGELAVSAKGSALAVWKAGRAGVHLSARDGSDANFGRVRRVSERRTTGRIEVAINSADRGLVTWQELDSFRFKARFVTPAGRMGRIEHASSPLRRNVLTNPHADISPRGHAALAWTKPLSEGQAEGKDIYVSERRFRR